MKWVRDKHEDELIRKRYSYISEKSDAFRRDDRERCRKRLADLVYQISVGGLSRLVEV